MEETLREEVQTFTRACEALAGFAQDNDGLTDAERGIVRNFLRALDFLRALEQEVAPSPPPQSPDDGPLAATLSNMPLID